MRNAIMHTVWTGPYRGCCWRARISFCKPTYKGVSASWAGIFLELQFLKKNHCTLASVKHNKLTFVRHKVTELTWKTKRCAAQDRLTRMDVHCRLARHAQGYLIAFPPIYSFWRFFPIVTRRMVPRRLHVEVVNIVTFRHNQVAASCVIYAPCGVMGLRWKG